LQKVYVLSWLIYVSKIYFRICRPSDASSYTVGSP